MAVDVGGGWEGDNQLGVCRGARARHEIKKKRGHWSGSRCGGEKIGVRPSRASLVTCLVIQVNHFYVD